MRMATSERNTTSPTRKQFVEATHVSVVIAGVLMATGGWSGLVWLVNNTYPDVPNRWAFFALLQLAVAGTAMPLIHFLHRRFAPNTLRRAGPGMLVRQASWVGLFVTGCAWLRIPRLLSLPIALVLAIALIIIEALLRLRERTQWRPE